MSIFLLSTASAEDSTEGVAGGAAEIISPQSSEIDKGHLLYTQALGLVYINMLEGRN